MTFSVTPAQGFVPPEPEDFGNRSVLVVQLAPASAGTLNTITYAPFTDWDGTVLLAPAADLAWSQESQAIVVSTAGLYAVEIQASLEDTDITSFNGAALGVIYGTEVTPAIGITQSEHYVNDNEGTCVPTNLVAWSDRFTLVVNPSDLPLSFQPKVYGAQYHNGGPVGDAMTCSGIITVTRLG